MSRYFGDQLRRLRLEQGLTQRDLAAAVGLSQAQISLHEKGEDLPAPAVRAKYAHALGISAEDLEEMIDRGRLKEFLRASGTLSEEAKRSIEDYVDFAWNRDREARGQQRRQGEVGKDEGSGDAKGLQE